MDVPRTFAYFILVTTSGPRRNSASCGVDANGHPYIAGRVLNANGETK